MTKEKLITANLRMVTSSVIWIAFLIGFGIVCLLPNFDVRPEVGCYTSNAMFSVVECQGFAGDALAGKLLTISMYWIVLPIVILPLIVLSILSAIKGNLIALAIVPISSLILFLWIWPWWELSKWEVRRRAHSDQVFSS